MKIEICNIGPTREKWIREGEDFYVRKCRRFTDIKTQILKNSRQTDPIKSKHEEAQTLMEYLAKAPKAYVVLLDERGTQFDSPGFAEFIENKLMHFGGSIRFITGGPFGVTDEVREACDAIVSISQMVFTHEMIRVILVEQLYRAFSILRGESYHHV